MPEVKRQTAYKCSVRTILEGNYVQKPGWEPNYVEINGLQISRANIMGVIVDKEGNSFTLDDGTSRIPIMFFSEEKRFKDIEIGDVVLFIGRPREYNQKRFLVPEIIRKIEDKRWIDYRKAELNLNEKYSPQQAKKEIEKEIKEQKKETQKEESLPRTSRQNESPIFEDNYASIILSTIKKLDKGDGANINDIIKESGLEKAEKYIISLINEGEIFEIRKGKIKILE